jgi:hypothetical protein
VDWIAAILTGVGSYLLSQKWRYGWLLSGIANLLWMAYAIWWAHSFPLAVLNIFMVTNAVRGFRNWKKGKVL